ncbi:winged helix DNA-binding domain-containing protein [Dendrothele bispora CBS 962.96]|uniref:Winged helix DNA-binding domain-containing protein n=1 Tax=Dendrothele bispora (strain CBS 962.96) TaxID=1314807 RepID=A0A4S8MEG8_DENBC|nr:winged helix DNA-binding domain-containing protein [Dendrothele bispora CBS 962.96]
MHRLTGPGLSAFDRHTQSQRSYALLSNQLSEKQIKNLHSQLSSFRTALTSFAVTHRDRIQRDPAFRHQFQQMCASIGVDPLAGPRRGGWWAELVGMGDWAYELGVQIVDVCVSTRERNGGMIEMGELIRVISKLRGLDKEKEKDKIGFGGGGEITEEDIVRSIKTLEPLGAGYQVVDIGGRKFVRSVVKELDQDQAAILALARAQSGRVMEEDLVSQHGWTRERARVALENMLLRDGMCWVDAQDPNGSAYWVPSAMRWD